MLHFKAYLKSKVLQSNANLLVQTGDITVDELKQAELELIKCVQARFFSGWLKYLSCHFVKRGISKSSPIWKLSPILLNGILRVGGRLENALITYESKHPVILPDHAHFAELMIDHHHKLVGHSGMNATLTSLRQYYWIENGRVATQRVLNNCYFAFGGTRSLTNN